MDDKQIMNKMSVKPAGDLTIDKPFNIDLEYMRYTFCRCCCKKKNETFDKYFQIVNQGSNDFKKDLDIIRFVQRMRSTSIALFYLLSSKQRKLVAHMSAFKPLREANEKPGQEETLAWDTIHN
jgi:hypothetical protein